MITLSSKVIDPPRPKSPPFEMAAVSSVTEAAAKTLPTKMLEVPSVADVPTCQYTWQANAPPLSTTLDPAAVIREVPIWKYQASLDEPVPTSVKAPVRVAELL